MNQEKIDVSKAVEPLTHGDTRRSSDRLKRKVAIRKTVKKKKK